MTVGFWPPSPLLPDRATSDITRVRVTQAKIIRAGVRPGRCGHLSAKVLQMPGNPLSDPNWATDVADLVETKVQAFRERTTDRVVMLTRGLVFGLLGGILGLALAALLLIGLTRGLQSLLQLGMSDERSVYVSYFIIGAIFVLVGIILMKKRHPHDD